MKVLMVEPGMEPYEKELNGLKEMQQAVGGLIQAIYPFEDKVAVVCDDEGMLKPNEFNRSMRGVWAVLCVWAGRGRLRLADAGADGGLQEAVSPGGAAAGRYGQYAGNAAGGAG